MRFVIAFLGVVFVSVSAVSFEDEGIDGSGRTSDNGDTFKLEENGPFWEKLGGTRSENGHRSINSDPDLNASDNQEDRQKLTLKEFLETYAKKHNKAPIYYDENTTQNLDKLIHDGTSNYNKKDKSQWTLLDVQRHKHPYDDRKGWVSLDPIPWSVSKISKWQSKYKPSSERPWDEHGPISSQRPYIDDDEFANEFDRPVSITPPNPYVYHHRPTESADRYDTLYDHGDRRRPTPASNLFARPTAYFGNKVHLEAGVPSSTGKPYGYHYQNGYQRPSSHHSYEEIITDGQPSNFPQSSPYDLLRRKGTEMEMHSENHPFNGEGEWILLSTTKGYKPPRNRQRSLQLDGTTDQSIRASRGVRLTVLPPLKGSNVNMTTSHGGLLQVESTFESVEQAKQKFDKKQNTLKIKGKRKRRKTNKKNINKVTMMDEVSRTPQYGDPSAVMAAVGAGMIPATMAMMVPIAMSG